MSDPNLLPHEKRKIKKPTARQMKSSIGVGMKYKSKNPRDRSN